MQIEVKQACVDIFSQVLKIDAHTVTEVEYSTCQSWDSLAHMELISCIEETFSLQLEEDHMVEITSLDKTVTILLGIMKKCKSY